MPQIDRELEVKDSTKIEEPPLYRVILHNDDYTTMEFVVNILETIFQKSREQAEMLTMQIHITGEAVCGVYTYEIAVTKADQVKKLARENSFPLLATVEIDEGD